ncbi:phosphatidylserine decarboxylase [Flavobacterium sp. Sd200]|uniref:acyl-CoA-binding protein n=1 Tax=Flavobacterium sp. Sd200 TaxID=2692211 RepID=UPI00136A336E|nr:acyl-CoA-binding protein [Flavobacterium sp. Sd200]MXN92511.1 phosphatidylserine decarboxylase [Flavobacterium sp. Sd200]
MQEKDLDTLFQEAYEKASLMTEALPQDVMLRIYAYYKQATYGQFNVGQHAGSNLRDAFKTNAWMQVSHISPDEAKKLYIETINSLTK